MIIARIESLIAGKPMSDALERAYAYVEAGADGIMIHSKNKSGEDIKEFCLTFRQRYAHVPIVVVPTTYDHIHESELRKWGGECGNLCQSHASCCLSGHDAGCMYYFGKRTSSGSP